MNFNFSSLYYLKFYTYLTTWTAFCTKEACDKDATLDAPSLSISHTVIVPLSPKVYKIFRESSMEICIIASSSDKAIVTNDGTKNDNGPSEWFIFLQRFPNQLLSAYTINVHYND